MPLGEACCAPSPASCHPTLHVKAPAAPPAAAAAHLLASPAAAAPSTAAAGGSAAAAATAAAAAGAGPALGPEEERGARLEHALRSLEVEVLQRGELLADLGEAVLVRQHVEGLRVAARAPAAQAGWGCGGPTTCLPAPGLSVPCRCLPMLSLPLLTGPRPQAGAPDGYGPTGLGEEELEQLLGAVAAHMDATCAADVTVVRRRKVGAGWGVPCAPCVSCHAALPSRPATSGRAPGTASRCPRAHLHSARRACRARLPQVPAPTVGEPDHHVADVCIRRRVGAASGPLEVRCMCFAPHAGAALQRWPFTLTFLGTLSPRHSSAPADACCHALPRCYLCPQVRVAVIGNVDAGKSTMVGLLECQLSAWHLILLCCPPPRRLPGAALSESLLPWPAPAPACRRWAC